MIDLPSFQVLKEHSEPLIVADTVQQRLLNVALDRLAFVDDQVTWEPPNTQTFDQYVNSCFDSMKLMKSDSLDFDFVLSSDQEKSLWFQIIREDLPRENSVTERTAHLAQMAHRIRNYWNVSSSSVPFSSEDSQAFSRWETLFTQRCEDLKVMDVPRFFTKHVSSRGRCEPFRSYGFFRPPPALKKWLEGNDLQGSKRQKSEGGTQKSRKYSDREQEILASLTWGMGIAAQDPACRVALVVPDELRIREQVDELICRNFGDSENAYFHWANSCETSADKPFVRLVLAILSLDEYLRWDTFSELITNPLLVGAMEEKFERAELDQRLRRLERYEFSLKSVIGFLKGTDGNKLLRVFLERMEVLIEHRRNNWTISEWTSYFRASLEAAGWPGTRFADPRFADDVKLWERSCDRLSSLGSVNPVGSKSFAQSRMLAFLREPIVQVGNCVKNPVYIVNLEQAVFVQPTHSWLLACEADREHTTHKMSPFLGIKEQRAVGLLGSDPNRDYLFFQELLGALLACSREVNVSYSMMVEESEKRPLTIFPTLSECDTERVSKKWPKVWGKRDIEWESIIDERGPCVSINESLGGTKVLADYNACAFKGFAISRLKAEPLVEPERGISRRKQGELVHQVLANLWSRLGRSSVLRDMSEELFLTLLNEELKKTLSSIPGTYLEGVLLEIEESRLRELMLAWFDIERRSGEFEVLETEYQYSTEIRKIAFKIRVDRIDRLADGSLRIVDYKTGNCESRAWVPSRMDDPQLTFYASTMPLGSVNSIAYAQVRQVRPRYLSWPPTQSAKIDLPQSWKSSATAWKSDLENTYALIAEGNAELFPKNGLDTCRKCSLQIFCRLTQNLGSKSATDRK